MARGFHRAPVLPAMMVPKGMQAGCGFITDGSSIKHLVARFNEAE